MSYDSMTDPQQPTVGSHLPVDTTNARRQRLNEGTQLGMALEGLTAADLAYRQQDVAA